MKESESRNDVSPHEFTAIRFYDNLHRNGRCRACWQPKKEHPIKKWVTARPMFQNGYLRYG